MNVHGVIRGMSQTYATGLERLYIAVDKRLSRWPSYQDHERIELTLIVRSRRHRVGIRTTPRDRYIWIGPDLDHGTPKLAQVLKAEGYSRHQRVVLDLEGSTLRLSPQ